MAGYVKLFGSILDSTIWRTPPAVTKVWIAMIAMADRYGEVMASLPGLADRARVPRATCEKALRIFMAPDRDSRTESDDGRRIERIDGGWRVLNYEKYREMDGLSDRRKKDAERQRRYYGRQKTGVSRDTHASLTASPPSPSPSPSPPPDPDQRGSGPLSRPGSGRKNGTPDLVAGTDRKLAELRIAAEKAATAEEVEELRKLRKGNGAP